MNEAVARPMRTKSQVDGLIDDRSSGENVYEYKSVEDIAVASQERRPVGWLWRHGAGRTGAARLWIC